MGRTTLGHGKNATARRYNRFLPMPWAAGRSIVTRRVKRRYYAALRSDNRYTRMTAYAQSHYKRPAPIWQYILAD